MDVSKTLCRPTRQLSTAHCTNVPTHNRTDGVRLTIKKAQWLFSLPGSYFRVRIAAFLKNVPLQIVDYGHSRDGQKLHKDLHYLGKNPNATKPTLEVHYGNGKSRILTQSLNMLEFFEENYPSGTRLIPPVTDISARCKARDLASLVACDIQPLRSSRVHNELRFLELRFFPSDPEAFRRFRGFSKPFSDKKTFDWMVGFWNHRLLDRTLKIYEAMAKKSAGKFSVGYDVSIADICLVSLIQNTNRFDKTFDDTTGHPTIARIVKTCEGVDAFRQHGVSSWSPQEQEDSQSTTATRRQSLRPGSTESGKESSDTGSFSPIK